MIQIEKLSKKIKGKTILKIDNLIIDKQFTIITGNSGAGKSTLLRVISTIDCDYDGNVFIDGVNLKNKEINIPTFRNKKIGFMFQDYLLDERLTVFENIEIPLLIAGCSKEERKKRIDDVLVKVHLDEISNQKAKTLSGGEKQRVAYARAIINNPEIVFADEPTSSLDESNAKDIMEMLKKLSKEGTMVVMVSHDDDLFFYGDQIITLKNGMIKDE